jgi:hypothetical protein
MALDLSKLKRQQAETTYKEGDYFKAREGKNILRVFKFSHKVTKEEAKAGDFNTDQVGKTVDELVRPVVRHFNVGGHKRPVLSCEEIMEKYERLKSEDEKAAEKIRPAKAFFMNVVDMDDMKSGMQPWACPTSVYNKILGFLLEEEYGGEEKLLGCKGRDFIVTYDPKANSPGEMYNVMLREKEVCKPLPDKAQDKVIDFYDPENAALLGEVYAKKSLSPAADGFRNYFGKNAEGGAFGGDEPATKASNEDPKETKRKEKVKEDVDDIFGDRDKKADSGKPKGKKTVDLSDFE